MRLGVPRSQVPRNDFQPLARNQLLLRGLLVLRRRHGCHGDSAQRRQQRLVCMNQGNIEETPSLGYRVSAGYRGQVSRSAPALLSRSRKFGRGRQKRERGVASESVAKELFEVIQGQLEAVL